MSGSEDRSAERRRLDWALALRGEGSSQFSRDRQRRDQPVERLRPAEDTSDATLLCW